MAGLAGRAPLSCTVVIPTYNERANIAQLVPEVLALGPGFRVLVVDDASPDGTGTWVAELARREPRVSLLARPGKTGLGTAYMEGLACALRDESDYVAMMDADFSHAPGALPAFLEVAKTQDADVVVGSRYVRGGRIRNWPLARHLLSRAGNAYARCLLGGPFTDYTSGFMLHRASALRQVPFERYGASDFAFLLELKADYAARGLRTVEVPIEFVDRARGVSKISWRVVREALGIVWQIRRRARGGRAGPRSRATPAAR
jgi:dolichol-phosphate mannosyltransferase